jgi:phage shock protein B
MSFPSEILIVPTIFIGLPWVVLHYVTRWKTASTLTNGDEKLLDQLYQLARRLDERMDTVERLVASEHPEFAPGVPKPDLAIDNQPLREYERLRGISETSLRAERERIRP